MPAMYTHFTHDFDSCETETPEFPKVYGKIFFNDCPDEIWDSFSDLGTPYGVVHKINYANNFVRVLIHGKEIEFELDGSSWSKCGNFKREMWDYQGEIETCVNES